MGKQKKYKIVLEVVTDEEIESVEDLLSGAWIYDNMFLGAVTKEKLSEIK